MFLPLFFPDVFSFFGQTETSGQSVSNSTAPYIQYSTAAARRARRVFFNRDILVEPRGVASLVYGSPTTTTNLSTLRRQG